MKLLPLRLTVLLWLLWVSIVIATYASMTFDHESSEWYGPNHPTRKKQTVEVTFDNNFNDFDCPPLGNGVGTPPPTETTPTGGGTTGAAP